ncbi:hypothetical protein D023_1358B, partial [Vibrio parahaemolyticus 3256]
APLSRYK